MDYKEIEKDALDSANNLKGISERVKFYSAAITDLLARAEAAEARAEKVEKERDGFKQRYIEMTNRACELSKIVDEHGLEE